MARAATLIRVATDRRIGFWEASRQPALYGMYFVARLDAVQGRVEAAVPLLARIQAGAARYGAAILDFYVGHARGLLIESGPIGQQSHDLSRQPHRCHVRIPEGGQHIGARYRVAHPQICHQGQAAGACMWTR